MEPLTIEEVTTLREWLASWGPAGQLNWADPTGERVPIGKTMLEKLLAAAERGVQAYAQDAISHAEAHGVR
jgi:hypothetical protein